MTEKPIVLSVENLHLGLRYDAAAELIHDVSVTIRAGERVGLVGQSGSGKSLLSLAIMGLLPSAIQIRSGTITVVGERVDSRSESDLVAMRGQSMAMVYQNPLSSLNPVMRIGDQIAEAIRAHRAVSWRTSMTEAVELLDRVGVYEPAVSARFYPHEFSGGMRQRAIIAMAISCEPAILLAEEPTTALDVTTQARILSLLNDLSLERGMAVLFVTHNLAVANGFCDRIDVMHEGQIVESGPTAQVLGAPKHPYTAALRNAICTLDTDPHQRLYELPPDMSATVSNGESSSPRMRGSRS